MTISEPQIALGIPLSDSNFQTPAPDGVPASAGWTVGTAMAGHLFGLHMSHPTLTVVTNLAANRHGVGRSLYIDGQIDMDGGSQSFIRTPPSHLGKVPSPGEEIIVNFGVLLTVAGSMASSTVIVKLEEYDEDRTLLATTTLGTMTQADFSASYGTKAFSKDVLKNAATQFFRLILFVDTNGNGNAYCGIDFIGLGWIPRNTGQDNAFYTFPEPYKIDNLSARPQSASEAVSLHGGFGHFVQQLGRGMQRWTLSMEWELMPQSFRDALHFFWYAQQGPIGSEDALTAGAVVVANDLGGEPWPLLLRPNLPGIKQAFYGRFVGEPFFSDIETRLGFVSDPLEWRAIARFEERVY